MVALQLAAFTWLTGNDVVATISVFISFLPPPFFMFFLLHHRITQKKINQGVLDCLVGLVFGLGSPSIKQSWVEIQLQHDLGS